MKYFYSVLFVAFVLVVWRMSNTADLPPCPYAEGLNPTNAGCMVVFDKQMLVVQQQTGKFNIPGGTSAGNEPAQCTAWRETMEETGLQVQVGELLKVYANGFHLFRCDLAQAMALAPIDKFEVKKALWLNSEQLDDAPWRFPAQLDDYRSWLR